MRIYYMISTPFEHQVYLGFSYGQTVAEPTIDTTYLGGQPLFLSEPRKEDLLCGNCPNQTLTFVCQLFCPLQLQHCYNRILYLFYCERCRRQFKCLKQQTPQAQPVNYPKIDTKTIKEQPIYVESQAIDIKELTKIKGKAKREVEQEVIAERQEEEFDSEEQGVQVKEIEINLDKLGLGKEEFFEEELGGQKMAGLKQMSQNMQEDKKEQKDPVFEQYRRVMKDLNDPVLLYSNIPILYNSQPVNPKHTCKHCKAKLSLQLQITQKMLLVSPKLIDLDWGCLLVFTCANSCGQSLEECVVVQYETDAVQDSQLTALKKRNKNKKRKEKSKQKKDVHRSKEKEKREGVEGVGKEEEGDWD